MTVASVMKITLEGRDITGRDEDRPENIPVRAWRIIMKSGWMEAGAHWHRTYLPLHFTKAAFHRYPQVYRPRSRGYYRRHHIDRSAPRDEQDSAIREARSKHRPLVFTGTLEAFTKQATVRAFQTRVAVVVPVPNYVSKRVRGAGVDVWAELTAVNSAEQESLTKIVSRQVEQATEQFLKDRTLPSLAG